MALADPVFQQQICGEIDRLNEQLSPHERLQAFAILPGSFTIRDGELTSTLKLRRAAIEKRYERVVHALFGEYAETTEMEYPDVTANGGAR